MERFVENIIHIAIKCRAFESLLYKKVELGLLKSPVYLSAGEEIPPATLSFLFQKIKPHIFAQHRGHSWYLSFGGNPRELIHELLGLESGCCRGMGGSASIHSPEINMFGHSGFMGDNIPIAVGAAFQTRHPTLAIAGDAAYEEDYALASLGWAATHNLPVAFVVMDNNFSILTPKSARRSWNLVDVARGFGIESFDIDDSPESVHSVFSNYQFSKPLLVNIHVTRKFWHAGAGTDESTPIDTLTRILDSPKLSELVVDYENQYNKLWEEALQ